MKLTPPGVGGVVRVPASGIAPPLPFTSDAVGDHRWTWTLTWRGTITRGTATTADGRWQARPVIGSGGGDLVVTARCGTASATATVAIRGTNPEASAITAHLAAKPGAAGFDRIVVHESRCRQFAANGLPLVSFDGGVGLCQLTHPPAAVLDAWDWRANLDAGLALFAAKRAAAERYLGHNGRRFTAVQAAREAVCRWNGGVYHVWSGAKWVRPAQIVCDPATGNIGWDMSAPANHGCTVAQLHARDAASYRSGHGSNWLYSGVCYADRLLGSIE